MQLSTYKSNCDRKKKIGTLVLEVHSPIDRQVWSASLENGMHTGALQLLSQLQY